VIDMLLDGDCREKELLPNLVIWMLPSRIAAAGHLWQTRHQESLAHDYQGKSTELGVGSASNINPQLNFGVATWPTR